MTKLDGAGKVRKQLDADKRVLAYDEAFMDDGRFMVTLSHGYAFDDAAANVGDDPDGASASHTRSFGTQAEAMEAVRHASLCRCGRCLPQEQQYVEAIDGLEFMPRLDDAAQYSTIFRGAKPLGTLQRRRVMDRSGPVWTLYATDGTKLREWHFRPSYGALAKAASYHISKFLGE
jgi:hypothetical protein